MDRLKDPYRQMIFVCVNTRAKGQRISCAGEGRCGEKILFKLKAYVKVKGLEEIVRVTKSGCLEKCEMGPNAALMPQNEILTGLSEKDADIIISTYLAAHSSS